MMMITGGAWVTRSEDWNCCYVPIVVMEIGVRDQLQINLGVYSRRRPDEDWWTAASKK